MTGALVSMWREELRGTQRALARRFKEIAHSRYPTRACTVRETTLARVTPSSREAEALRLETSRAMCRALVSLTLSRFA